MYFDVFCLCLEDFSSSFTLWKVSTGCSQTWVSGPEGFGLGEVRLQRRRWFVGNLAGWVTPKGMRTDPIELDKLYCLPVLYLCKSCLAVNFKASDPPIMINLLANPCQLPRL
jgi:hypothetical protein